MDITSTRLNTLISDALTPQPVPLPKADPATTALIKTLVQPPTPPSAQAAQFAAQALTNSLQVPLARSSQRSSSNPVEDAYRAMMEPDADAEYTPSRTQQGRPLGGAENGPRANATAQPLVAAGAAAAAPVMQPPSSVAAAVPASPALVAANANAPQPRGAGGRPAGHAPRSESVSVSLWTISVVTAVVSAVTTTIIVFLLR
ncbi:hypothetical protein DPM33_13790 [Mesorhizobium hawassense]|uniref:Uncharacterized protein n=1 Tax=Mesorhizobium hawassense TaxID=1209954 RepID=A0A330HVD2_9HYPH|nr:hypothetical protein [Mesorhizobium hawassense]RAZ90569.1 hypothetical protein DPM33_13790 [Mesorhizobium hawassense]